MADANDLDLRLDIVGGLMLEKVANSLSLSLDGAGWCFLNEKATLRYYEAEFHKKYNPANVEAAVVYWDIDEQGWRTFQMENFLEWRVMG